MMRARPAILAVLLAVLLVWQAGGAHATEWVAAAPAVSDDVATPIVAEILADPAAYEGDRIRIHGIVTRPGKHAFHLTDVSQQSIHVATDLARRLDPYLSVTVAARVIRADGEPRLIAERIYHVDEKVLGGPCGCTSRTVLVPGPSARD